LSQLFGCKPNYYVTYSDRNAVWGFQFNDNRNNTFLFYSSQRGIFLKVNNDFDINEVENLYKELNSILINPDYASDYFKRKREVYEEIYMYQKLRKK